MTLPSKIGAGARRAITLGAWMLVALCPPACNPVSPTSDNRNDNPNGNSAPSADDALLDPDVAPVVAGEWRRPAVDATWQWQLQPQAGAALNTTYDVAVYDIDLFDADAAVIRQLQNQGRLVICYFSAGSYEAFREDAEAFPVEALGTLLEGYDDERWLDIRSAAVAALMRARLDIAVEKGCAAVEPDNVDGYQNASGFDLTARDQLAFNRFLANAAHDRGLAVGLKNDLDQVADLVAYFDFAVNEQCYEYDECASLDPFIAAGKPVFNAEYLAAYANDANLRAELCADAHNQNRRTLVLPVDLDDSFRFSCD